MEKLLDTNDPVLISLIESILSESQITYFIADSNMSVLEGSLGFLPRRIMVDKDYLTRARRLMEDAGLGHELPDPS